ncbi:purine-nucleoside phosphorylase [Helicobacter valdiviensis]|uniref:Purine-nucleoside phosphorylase n=1 Tax=Helicobacter valdiviensis TaxID=1458358 RepID=A0A2W6MS95_9HELI|nr:purine-nucleoside phosphorylase [Helicobacter valdiviensis]PZT47342.1 purine-nucleoside phosphorylase [Helicobacter valdiviensis]
MIYCAGEIESFPFAKSIGVGLVQSAINLTHSIYRDKPDEIIFIGTCGSYDRNQKLLEIFETQSASNIELSFLEKKSYTPLDNFICLEKQNVSHETLLNQNQKIVNCSNYISTDESLAQIMVKLGILYENMEFFSILQVAKNFEIPAFGIFCVTNHIHKDSQKEFFSNHNEAKKRLENYIKENYREKFYV